MNDITWIKFKKTKNGKWHKPVFKTPFSTNFETTMCGSIKKPFTINDVEISEAPNKNDLCIKCLLNRMEELINRVNILRDTLWGKSIK